MIGKLIGAVVRVATLPAVGLNVAADVVTGGSGSKRSRTRANWPLGGLERVRDRVAEAAEDIDQEGQGRG